ncbi:hypothetical protein V6N12_045284 [Hibiscus sabdariffa]|uniref:DUF4283 domain-containing protein n=1 Tax=Hibiscus sabdariffa TaxID=183260 RepID=A0ABR2G317_9ROSI
MDMNALSGNPKVGQLLVPPGRPPNAARGTPCALQESTVVAGNSPSFHDMVIGRSEPLQQDNFISVLDVEFPAEDMIISRDGAFPEIHFSDKIHQEIDSKLTKSVIARLLGKSIGYRALKNREHALWNPSGELSIIDLDNDYYLIQFALEVDYEKVLSGGLRGRFTLLVVVVSLDKPLIPEIVIDGVYQAIEYEALPVICFGCGKYGHPKEGYGLIGQRQTRKILLGNRNPPWRRDSALDAGDERKRRSGVLRRGTGLGGSLTEARDIVATTASRGENSSGMVHQEPVSMPHSSPRVAAKGKVIQIPLFFHQKNTLRFGLSMMVHPVFQKKTMVSLCMGQFAQHILEGPNVIRLRPNLYLGRMHALKRMMT